MASHILWEHKLGLIHLWLIIYGIFWVNDFTYILDDEERQRLQAEKLPGFYKGGESDEEEEDSNISKEDDRKEEIEDDQVVESDEEDDDDWITPDNIKEIDDGDALEEEREDTVACLTIDFAMQNVLLK